MDQPSDAERPEHSSGGGIDYQSIVAASVDPITVAGLDGLYCYVSPACHRVFGWESSELEGRSEDDFVHPDDVSLLRARRAQDVPAEPATTTYRFRCRDGSYRWVEATSRRVVADASALVVSTVHDITERERRTAALEHRAG